MLAPKSLGQHPVTLQFLMRQEIILPKQRFQGGVAPELEKANYRTLVALGFSDLSRVGTIRNYIELGSLNEEQVRILLQILSVNKSNSRNNYQDFFASWEEAVFGYSSLSEEQKVVLYCALSVGRSSAAYWSAQIGNLGSSNWQSWISTPQQGSDELPKWLKADIGGAISGAIRGAFTLTPAGVVTGATAGAVGASVSSVVLDIIDPTN